MNDEVFRALLALDSYNRGYNPGIGGLDSDVGSFLGAAERLRTDGLQDAQDIGFYAIAYTWDHGGGDVETIISYRGTDTFPRPSMPANRKTGRSLFVMPAPGSALRSARGQALAGIQ